MILCCDDACSHHVCPLLHLGPSYRVVVWHLEGRQPPNEGSQCCSHCQALPCRYLCLRQQGSLHLTPTAHPSQNPSPLDMPSKSLCSTPLWSGRSANIQQQYQVKSIKQGITWKVYWQIHGFSLNILHLEQVDPGKLYGNWRPNTWYYTREDTADNKEDLMNVSSFSGFLNVDSILLRIKKLIHPCISAPRWQLMLFILISATPRHLC